MRVLVTGATGFIGYHTAKRLRAERHEVRVLVRDREKAARVLAPLDLEREAIVIGDMTDSTAVMRALEGCDAAIHTAAAVSVTTGRADFSENLRGTETVVGLAIERALYTVYVSSVIALFDPRQPLTENSPIARCKTHYGRSKAECEAWVRERQAAGATVAIVYPAAVVGPEDPGMSESVKAYRSFLRGTLQSEGGNQMLDVRDLALLLTRMLETRTTGRVVAAGHFLDWDEFTTLLEEVSGARIPRIRAPGWVLRAASRTLDVVGRVTGQTMPMTGEGIEIATRFSKMSDSKAVAALGVTWRDPHATLSDLFAWFLEAGHLPASAVPALAASTRR